MENKNQPWMTVAFGGLFFLYSGYQYFVYSSVENGKDMGDFKLVFLDLMLYELGGKWLAIGFILFCAVTLVVLGLRDWKK